MIYDGTGHPHVVSSLEAPDPVTRARFLFLATPAALPAVVFGPDGPRDTRGGAELKDNAHLFAAAWGMLGALKRIAEWEYRTDRRARGMVDASEVEALKRIARSAIAGLRGAQ